MARNRHLTPMQKRILHVLLDKNSTVETSAEIATELMLSKDSVDHQLAGVYAHYGVRSARGLFRCLEEIAAELR